MSHYNLIFSFHRSCLVLVSHTKSEMIVHCGSDHAQTIERNKDASTIAGFYIGSAILEKLSEASN